MKSLIFNFSSIALCFICCISLSAQDPEPEDTPPITRLGTIHNDGDGHDILNHYCFDEGNTMTVYTDVILGGLDFVEVDGEYYGEIPSNVLPMMIEFTINGNVYPPQELGLFELIELENQNLAFKFTAQSPTIDFSAECLPDDAFNDYVEGAVYVSVKIRLVTPIGQSEYGLYPACNYAQENEMFSCYIYDYAPWCDNTPSPPGFGASNNDDDGVNCYDEWFTTGFIAYMHCDCEDDVPHEDPPGDVSIKNNDSILEDGTESEVRKVEKIEVSVYPNPMQDVLNFESESDKINKIEIYDAKGNVLISNDYVGHGTGKLNIDTSILPNGLYLARVTTINGTKVVKVLK